MRFAELFILKLSKDFFYEDDSGGEITLFFDSFLKDWTFLLKLSSF